MKTNPKITSAIVAALSAHTATCFAQAAPSGGLEEVVVTAQRRSESIQDVPITIQAITGEQLSQLAVSTFDDVLKYLPNVTFSPNGPGQGNIYMRGLSAGFAGNQSSAAIAPFPNVALYLDDQSMTFPSRNVDVYMVDMERVEVLEGPQGTLFGGGAEAGAVRYITNKPKLTGTEGYAEASYGVTAHGDPNSAISGTLNLPLIQNVLAVRAVIYNERRGGYIDNVASTLTRFNTDPGALAYHATYPANAATANNFALAAKAQNPVSYTGLRVSGLWQVNDEWNALLQQSYQNMEADGMFVQFPVGSDHQTLGALQENSFSPAWDKDKWTNTALTINGRFGDIRAVYTGAYLSRTIDNAMDYSNYVRSAGGFYYTCPGGPNPIGAGRPLTCYSPVSSWHDYVETTHQSHEIRLSTPDEWRVRGLVGGFWEDFDIKDDMNFLYKSIPSCTPANLAAYRAGTLTACVGNVIPYFNSAGSAAAIDPTARNDLTAFGEDLRRGYKQTAFFTSIDFDLVPKVLTLTGGTRYYKYTESMHGSQYSTSTSCVGIPNGTCVGSNLTAATHAADYSGFRSRGNLTWKVTSDAMVYYTYSQGFRPGAGNRKNSAEVKIDVNPVTNQPVVGPDPNPFLVKQYNKPYTYPPDTLINNELGWKTEWFDRRLQINGSAYIMDWKDVQTQIYNPPIYGNTTFGVKGPTYRIKGAELQLAAKVTPEFTLIGAISHNSAEETNNPCIQSSNNVAHNPTPIGQCLTQVWSPALSQNVPLQNPLGANGATPAFSPKLQYNLRGRYDWGLSEYRLFAMVGLSHTDEMSNEPSSFQSGVGVLDATTTWLRYVQPAYTVWDGSFGVSRDKWTAEAYGVNLSNSNASLYTSSGQFIRAEVPLRPRVVGLKIGYRF